jgi:hypothetical protein
VAVNNSHEGKSFGFLAINVCNHGENYETPCLLCMTGIDTNASATEHKGDASFQNNKFKYGSNVEKIVPR